MVSQVWPSLLERNKAALTPEGACSSGAVCGTHLSEPQLHAGLQDIQRTDFGNLRAAAGSGCGNGLIGVQDPFVHGFTSDLDPFCKRRENTSFAGSSWRNRPHPQIKERTPAEIPAVRHRTWKDA